MRRAKARSARKPTVLNVPVKFGVPDNTRKEDSADLRRDILGPLFERHVPVVPDQSRANLLAAFDKRCNYTSSERVDPKVVAASRALLDKIAPHTYDPLVMDLKLFEDWNAQFDSGKQARHVKAYAKLSSVTSAQFSDKQIFVKVEALLKRHDAQWAPRIIYQSSDLHNVLLGPVMWKCTKRMFACFQYDASGGGPMYMGAYSKQAPELVDFIHRHGTSDTVYVESDFSSNDMTQLEDVHLLELEWLSRFGAPVWLTALMHVANRFRATSHKHRVKAVVTNQLPTGAQSTTFRNSLWNASINFCWASEHGFLGDVLILGDDMLMRLDNPKFRRQALRRSYEYVTKRAGMKAVVSVRRHLSECEFLSKQFIPDRASFVMAPKLGKGLARFNVRATSNEAVSDREYIAGKALSYAYEFRFVGPVSRLFLLRFAQCEIDDPHLDALGWNAKGAFLQLGTSGVIRAIDTARSASRDDITRFYHYKYALTCLDVVDLVTKILFGDRHLDSAEAGFVLADFV
jgi:hypothetical protein